MACNEKQLNGYEITLNEDLKTLDVYFKQWRHRPNPDKIQSLLFDLNKEIANQSLNITFCGHNVKRKPLLKYLGLMIDRQFSYT